MNFYMPLRSHDAVSEGEQPEPESNTTDCLYSREDRRKYEGLDHKSKCSHSNPEYSQLKDYIMYITLPSTPSEISL
jgi:hypothetical protein